MKLKYFLPGILIITGLFSCIDDTIQIEDLSGDLQMEREQAFPLIKATLVFEDLAGDSYDSLIIDPVLDSIKLFELDEISYQDTFSLGEVGENIDFEYINLYHSVTNMFPAGLDLRLYLYDSIIAQNIDTIWFTEVHGDLFIQPAPLDANELVIEDQVETVKGMLSLDQDQFNNLFHGASHIVLDAAVPSTGAFVKILNHYSLKIDLGLAFKGSYILTPSEEN